MIYLSSNHHISTKIQRKVHISNDALLNLVPCKMDVETDEYSENFHKYIEICHNHCKNSGL